MSNDFGVRTPPDTIVRPAYCWAPEHLSSAGQEAAEFGESIGIYLDPEQRLALDVILAEAEDGRWAAFEAALIASRQNLKTFLFQLIALSDLFLFGSELIVWTAHLFPTSVEAFRNVKVPLESYDHLRRRVKKVTEANGEEGIELLSGQRLLFKARSKSGGRGLTGNRVILDEAFALSPSEMGALLPTLSAVDNPQVLYGSSAGMVSSSVLRDVRDRGRAGGDPSLAYLEWCAPVVDCEDDWCDHRPPVRGCALDDVELWRKANPAMGRRITVAHIAAERRALPPGEFARERLGWWEEPQDAAAGVPLDLWGACLNVNAKPVGVAAFAVDVTPDFSWASIGKADTAGLVEVVAHERGTNWIAQRIIELRGGANTPVVMDLAGPASVARPALMSAGIEPVAASSRDMAQACAGFVDAVVQRRIVHRGQDELEAAVRGASRAPLGDSFKWSRKSSSVDISPLVAVTLAAWAASQDSAAPNTGLVDLNDFMDDDWFDDEG